MTETLRRRLPADLQDPLLRNAYALVVNAGIGAALGVGYWVIAARLFPAADVGEGQALINAMRMLAALTSFGFVGALTRFVPETGRATGRFVGAVYLLGGGLGLVATAVFVVATKDEPGFRILWGWVPAGVFALVVIVWSVYTLQEVVLSALRRSTWVPVVNVAVGFVKVTAVAACAFLVAARGDVVSWQVFLAWIVPCALAVLPVNYLLFVRVIPRHVAETAHRTPPSLKRIARFAGGDYFGSVFTLAAIYLIPVVVATQVDHRTYAYYGIAVTVGGLLEIFAFTMATSLTVEGSFDPAALGRNTRRALHRSLTVLIPMIVVVVLAAPLVLAVFGAEFADNGTTLLRLIALATLARAFVELHLGALRALGRGRALLSIQAVRCALALALTWLLLPRHGIEGVGIALVVTQSVMAAAVAPALFRLCRPNGAKTGSVSSIESPPSRHTSDDSETVHTIKPVALPFGGIRRLTTARISDPIVDGPDDDAPLPSGPEEKTGTGGEENAGDNNGETPAEESESEPETLSESEPPESGIDHQEIRTGDLDSGTVDPKAEIGDFDVATGAHETGTGESHSVSGRETAAGDSDSDSGSESGGATASGLIRVVAPGWDVAPAGELVVVPERVTPPKKSGRLAGAALLIRQPREWLGAVITIQALVMYVLAMKARPTGLVGVDLYAMTGLGLVSVMPPVALLAVALLIVSFFDTLTQKRNRPVLLLFQILAVMFALHGAAVLVEPLPRFPVAWTIGGFVDYIARTGETLTALDARFNWPGFSVFSAFMIRAAGVEDAAALLNWWPLISNVAYLIPLVVIVRRLQADRRAKWLALMIFVVSQWVGQDYFSPQGMTYLLYLLFVAILVTWFLRVEPASSFWRRRWTLIPGERAPRKTTVTDRVIILVLIVLIFVATATSHQITPFMMCGVLLGFVVFRRTRLSFMMVVLFGAIVAAYVNYMAVAYWSGHLDAMVGSVGQVGGNLTSQTTGRISSTNPERLVVLYTRLAITGVILGLAGLGLLRRLKKGIGDRVVFVMMVVPVLSLAMLSYGGELGLRVYLFTLPATSILVAYLFYPGLPSKVPPKRRFPVLATLRPVVACALVLGLAGAFLLARFGNEKYEWTSPQERAAIDYIYEQDLETTRILYLVPEGDGGSSISWSLTGVERVRQIRATAGRDPYKVDNVVEQLRDAGPGSFILATRSQEASLEIDANYPADWGPKIRVSLAQHPDLKTLVWNDDAAVYALKEQPTGRIAPQLRGTPFRIGETPWTPYGLVALAIFVLIVLTREVIRIRQRPGTWYWSRRLAWLSLPFLLLAGWVVLERFMLLSV
ncbi:lipopolysaccharide biosynthesis protein [Herbidospora cretacea]|uniref:lipopolysaccharide biosynthesis protein n=1 Tax=Herbidospora cretacea TaxID=28444 RepID=UPI0004C415CD|nr:lipopolysaccharide biosynthesis protein [Herbidospora cretacea]